jgi:glycosyltransferase involved in cell wall biosynthesis
MTLTTSSVHGSAAAHAPSTSSPPQSRARSRIVVDGRMIGQDQCHGIARVTIEMLRHFPAPSDSPAHSDIPVTLIVPTDLGGRFSLDGLPDTIDVVPCSAPVGAPYRVVELTRLLRKVNAGVMFSPYHALAPLYTPCPLVVGVHDCILESDRRLVPGRVARSGYIANTVRVLRQAAGVVAPSQATASTLGAYYRNLPPVTVCRNGVAPAQFATEEGATSPSVRELRLQYGLPDRYVLHIGSRRQHKNQSVLVEALSSLDPDVGLVLLGHRDPRVHDPVDGLIQRLGVQDRVHCLDSLPDAAMPALYQGAAAFAFPSTAEGFGLPPLEAMAAGVPVVASSIPAVAEVCGDAAILVSPYDAAGWASNLNRVLSDRALRDRLVLAGRAAAEQAGWETGAHALHALLSGFVLSAAGRPALRAI